MALGAIFGLIGLGVFIKDEIASACYDSDVRYKEAMFGRLTYMDYHGKERLCKNGRWVYRTIDKDLNDVIKDVKNGKVYYVLGRSWLGEKRDERVARANAERAEHKRRIAKAMEEKQKSIEEKKFYYNSFYLVNSSFYDETKSVETDTTVGFCVYLKKEYEDFVLEKLVYEIYKKEYVPIIGVIINRKENSTQEFTDEIREVFGNYVVEINKQRIEEILAKENNTFTREELEAIPKIATLEDFNNFLDKYPGMTNFLSKGEKENE